MTGESKAVQTPIETRAAKVIWFTGLPGSGKSTLAQALAIELKMRSIAATVLDGDVLRNGLNRGLGFCTSDRLEANRRAAEVAKLIVDTGVWVLVAMVSPLARGRTQAKQVIGEANLVEVYVNTPLDICEARDPKGLYAKARRSSNMQMTGIDSVYEVPEGAKISIDTSQLLLSQCMDLIRPFIENESSS